MYFDRTNAAYVDSRNASGVPLVAATGPTLVFGGCYSNLEATRALRQEAQNLGIPADHIICTGDIVAYCADAEATVAEVRDWGIHVVQGNCEEALATGADDCGCGFEPGSTCDRLSAAWFAHAKAQLSAASRAWMRSLPKRLDLTMGGRRLAVVHAAVDSLNRFVFASTPWPEKAYQIRLSVTDGIIAGHSGLPFTEAKDGLLWHNSGALGMPANDGTPRVWYSLLIPNSKGITVRAIPLAYDNGNAARKVRAAGLPEGYATALEIGVWPSSDILLQAELQAQGRAIAAGMVEWPKRGKPCATWPQAAASVEPVTAETQKFSDPFVTALGQQRAVVPFARYETLWLNTGTLCNITCHNCYIESSPKNDRLAYLTRCEARSFLDEAIRLQHPPREIGFTGGEPFLNPDMMGMLEDSLAADFRVLVLTNAMKPMQRQKPGLLDLHTRYPGRMTLRVSLDHYEPERHEAIRGRRSWEPAINGLKWLSAHGFSIAVAGRTLWGETERTSRDGFARLFANERIAIDAYDPARLVLFPEMDESQDVPEITEVCWNILGKTPSDVMCATSRMVVKRKGAAAPVVVSCTLLPYDTTFEMGGSLAEAAKPVHLNHRHCARFCVLGGASCSAKG